MTPISEQLATLTATLYTAYASMAVEAVRRQGRLTTSTALDAHAAAQEAAMAEARRLLVSIHGEPCESSPLLYRWHNPTTGACVSDRTARPGYSCGTCGWPKSSHRG